MWSVKVVGTWSVRGRYVVGTWSVVPIGILFVTLLPTVFKMCGIVYLIMKLLLSEQNIVNTVGTEMHRLLDIFRSRNPSFTGEISVCGHSLGKMFTVASVVFFVEHYRSFSMTVLHTDNMLPHCPHEMSDWREIINILY